MKRSIVMFTLPFIALLVICVVLFGKSCDYIRTNTAEKEIPFNHKSHLAKMDTSDSISIYGISSCEDCHGYNDNGRFQGIPTIETCVVCHDRSKSTKAAHIDGQPVPVRKPMFDNYEDSDSPWESYARQPDLVYFSHNVVMTAVDSQGTQKARCGSCHGNREDNTMAETYIKGKMLMDQCMDCHTALGLSNKCAVCHD